MALSSLFDRMRPGLSETAFLKRMGSMKTTFFRKNGLERPEYERRLLQSLDRKFKKKSTRDLKRLEGLANGIASERAIAARLPRRTVRQVLRLYRHGLEARGIGAFWASRSKGRLRPNPERIAHLALTLVAYAVIQDDGLVLNEFESGVGYVDVGIVFAKTLHLVELKVLRSGALKGPAQLGRYMQQEHRRHAWLVVLDARPPKRKSRIVERVKLSAERTVHILSVDINPPVPSRS